MDGWMDEANSYFLWELKLQILKSFIGMTNMVVSAAILQQDNRRFDSRPWGLPKWSVHLPPTL